MIEAVLAVCCLAQTGESVPPTTKTPPPLPMPSGQTLPPAGALPNRNPPIANSPPDAVAANVPVPHAAPVRPVIRNVFLRQYDRDHDGRLAPDELPRKFVKHFAGADSNGDGYLDGDEILHDHRSIGKAARKLEDLELKDGKLISRADLRAGRPPTSEVIGAIAGEADLNGDGFIEPREAGAAVKQKLLPRLGDLIQRKLNQGREPNSAETQPPPVPADSSLTPPAPTEVVPLEPALPNRKTPPPPPVPFDAEQGGLPAQPPAAPSAEMKPVPADPTAPKPTAPTPRTAGKGGKKGAGQGDALPTAKDIIAGLDKDGDGMVGRDEAVDQLAKNFDRLDKNKDGKLSEEEIDAGLRLARLFGIKPMKPPGSYAPGSDAKTKQPTPK